MQVSPFAQSSFSQSAFAQELIRLINAYRVSNGRGRLAVDPNLGKAAQQASTSLQQGSLIGRAQNAGYEVIPNLSSSSSVASQSNDRRISSRSFSSSGFLGFGVLTGQGHANPSEVFNAWVSDSNGAFRQNLLASSFDEIGVGYDLVLTDPSRYHAYWTVALGDGFLNPPSIDSLQYLASHGDLIAAFGYNADSAVSHWQNFGYSEGRLSDTFDELQYLASHGDLIAAFDYNLERATQHYIEYGYKENRSKDTFDEAQYLASNRDLITAFGYNRERATQHYIEYGYEENRSKDTFNEAQYLASHRDLLNEFSFVFGLSNKLEAATFHYISYGASEGRATNLFNAQAYLNKYGDLRAAFGNNLQAATNHFVEFGYDEGRSV